MPDLIPKPRRTPPSRVDHILSHPGTFAAACSWIVYGTLLALPTFLPGNWEPSVTLSLLPEGIAVLNGGMLLFGGVATVWSIQTLHNRLDRVWDAQRAALILAMFGWLAHIIVVMWFTIGAVVSWMMGITNFFIALLSLVALSRVEGDIRSEMREQGMDA